MTKSRPRRQAHAHTNEPGRSPAHVDRGRASSPAAPAQLPARSFAAAGNERRLVEAAQRGESTAVEALYRTHHDSVYRYLLVRLGSVEAAEDVTSQVFLAMVKGLGGYRQQGVPFVGWLFGIARKQLAHHSRGRQRAPQSVELDAAEGLIAATAGPHASAEEREHRVTLARAIRELPDAQQEVITMRFVLSMSVLETASIMGRSEGAVKQLQSRALEALKGLLQKEGF